MAAEVRALRVAVADAAAPSVGDVLRFAAYMAGLVGEDRVTGVSWNVAREWLHVDVSDALHAEVLAHLLGLDARADHWAYEPQNRISTWSGHSGVMSVFLTAPLALGGLPLKRKEYEYGFTEVF